MVAQVAQNQNRMMSVISQVGVKFKKGLEVGRGFTPMTPCLVVSCFALVFVAVVARVLKGATLQDIKEHVEDLEGKVDEKVGEVKERVNALQLDLANVNANLDQKISAVLQDTDFKVSGVAPL